MSVQEAPIHTTPTGEVPGGPGWYVLNLAAARGGSMPGHGVFCSFEPPEARFEDFGINVHVLQPGERSALYHRESVQEAFLVLSGECIVVVEEQERTLRPWDFLHCPAGTAHAFVGAGSRPCAILMVGARRDGATAHYPVSGAAARHGLSARSSTDESGEAYAGVGWPERLAPVRMPWPP